MTETVAEIDRSPLGDVAVTTVRKPHGVAPQIDEVEGAGLREVERWTTIAGLVVDLRGEVVTEPRHGIELRLLIEAGGDITTIPLVDGEAVHLRGGIAALRGNPGLLPGGQAVLHVGGLGLQREDRAVLQLGEGAGHRREDQVGLQREDLVLEVGGPVVRHAGDQADHPGDQAGAGPQLGDPVGLHGEQI